MPAVELSRLYTRLALLLRDRETPRIFASRIQELYQSYADPTQPVVNQPRPGAEERFNTPLILNLEVEKILGRELQSDPIQLLEICDRLWDFPQVELRQLAASLLGKLPFSSSDEVLKRIDEWSKQVLDSDLLKYLHAQATITIRRQEPGLWLRLLSDWVRSAEKDQKAIAIYGLLPLIQDRSFDNLPQVFTFLFPLLKPFQPDLAFELETVIRELALRSEVETVYFLKQLMGADQVNAFGRFVRRSLDAFSLTSQASLKSALKDHPSLS